MIVEVIQHYYPEWQPPTDRGREWHLTLCPFHGESHPSAAVSYVHDAFVCHACGVKGNARSLIKKKEGVHGSINKVTAELLEGRDEPIQEELGGITRRGVPTSSGPRLSGNKRDGRQVQSGVRRFRFGQQT